LHLSSEKPVSKCAIKFNLRRYTAGLALVGLQYLTELRLAFNPCAVGGCTS
jgi:hypothetical protein